MSKKDKPWYVINDLGIQWQIQFSTEEAAWRRVVAISALRKKADALNHDFMVGDLERRGWKVLSEVSEVTSEFGRKAS